MRFKLMWVTACILLLKVHVWWIVELQHGQETILVAFHTLVFIHRSRSYTNDPCANSDTTKALASLPGQNAKRTNTSIWTTEVVSSKNVEKTSSFVKAAQSGRKFYIRQHLISIQSFWSRKARSSSTLSSLHIVNWTSSRTIGQRPDNTSLACHQALRAYPRLLKCFTILHIRDGLVSLGTKTHCRRP